MTDAVKRVCEQWISAGYGEDCFWEKWPECPCEDSLTPNQVMSAVAKLEAEIERLTAERNETAMLLSLHMKRAEKAEAERDEALAQVGVLDPRIYWLNAEALAEIKATVDGESDQDVGHIIYGLLDEIAALTPAPQAVIPTEQEAVPVAWRYRYVDPVSGEPIWRYSNNLWNGQRPSESQPLYVHPPQPSETVAEAIAAIEALNVIKTGLWCGGYISRKAALRALKGESVND